MPLSLILSLATAGAAVPAGASAGVRIVAASARVEDGRLILGQPDRIDRASVRSTVHPQVRRCPPSDQDPRTGGAAPGCRLIVFDLP